MARTARTARHLRFFLHPYVLRLRTTLLIRRVVLGTWRGFIELGRTWYAAGERGAEETPRGPALRGPGPGHPERVIRGLPLTDEELLLWTEFARTRSATRR
ncbi:hypothetical protein GCM10022403_042350 [Streptomyces coacervatus]|uniref:Uncharacterized protein n=2 Tax=Streptomyces coacervatus TaxID=647381 RepID=A0ABP7HXJ1_9ACTN